MKSYLAGEDAENHQVPWWASCSPEVLADRLEELNDDEVATMQEASSLYEMQAVQAYEHGRMVPQDRGWSRKAMAELKAVQARKGFIGREMNRRHKEQSIANKGAKATAHTEQERLSIARKELKEQERAAKAREKLEKRRSTQIARFAPVRELYNQGNHKEAFGALLDVLTERTK